MWLQQTEKALEQWWESSWCSRDCHLVKHGLERAQAIKTLISAVLAEWTSRLCMATDRSTSLKVSITQDVDWQDGKWHRKHMPTQTQWHAAGEDQLCLLGFHQRLSGKEMCLCFLTASRDLFVNVTLVKSSATVSPVDAIFSLERKKTADANYKITHWYLFYFIIWMIFWSSAGKTILKLESLLHFLF